MLCEPHFNVLANLFGAKGIAAVWQVMSRNTYTCGCKCASLFVHVADVARSGRDNTRAAVPGASPKLGLPETTGGPNAQQIVCSLAPPRLKHQSETLVVYVDLKAR